MDAPTTSSPAAARPTAHGRTKSSFSLSSRTSQDSQSKRPKISTREAAEAEKRHKQRFDTDRLNDPNMAVREAEPADRNLAEKRTMAVIREIDWKDIYGNPITDPDASNPSRARMERPLDTIRAFEAAIESQYRSKRPKPKRPEATENAHVYESRRSSVVGTDPSLNMRSPWSRQRSANYADAVSARPPNPRYSTAPPRTYSDAAFYPVHGYRESYETVGTGESYGSSHVPDGYGHSTDPSSENSSVDRVQQAAGYHPHAASGAPSPANGHSPERQARPSYQPPPSPLSQQQNYTYNAGPRPAPQQHGAEPRNVIPLGGAAPPPPPKHNILRKEVNAASRPAVLQREPSEKRQSWLRRRFSRH